ncbi:MAG: hypothetical protein V8P98_04620 [Acutalibacteraceae bacterium]
MNSLYAELLIRNIVCENLKISNSKINFYKNSFGKPYLTDYENFYFNISHSGDFVICAISDHEVGVDIQKIKPISTAFKEKFVGRKNASLEDFYSMWVLEESYVKFLGKSIIFLAKNLSLKKQNVYYKTYNIHPNYKISVCSGDNKFYNHITHIEKEKLDKFFYENNGEINGKI